MNDPMSETDRDWTDVGAAADLPPGSVMEAVVGDRMVAVANVDGHLYAIDGVCAHQGGPLGKGHLQGCVLTCPWHGWQYDVTTGVQQLGRSIRQASFAVRRAGDRIVVRASQPPE